MMDLEIARAGGKKEEGPTPYQERKRRCWVCKQKGHTQAECPMALEKAKNEAAGDKDFRVQAPPQSKASSSSYAPRGPPPPFSKARGTKPAGEVFFESPNIILKKRAPAKIQKPKK